MRRNSGNEKYGIKSKRKKKKFKKRAKTLVHIEYQRYLLSASF